MLFPAAILFDLDGTLVDTERESAEAMVRALAEDGIQCDAADRDFIVGRSWVEIHRHLRARYPLLTWDLDELIERVADGREEIYRKQEMVVMPGACAAIARFSRLSLAIVTGSSRREATQALIALGSASAFSCVIAAEDVPTSKPDPGGYLLAASRLGVDAAACVVVEDSAAGIQAGLAAGARVVAVRHGNFAAQDQSRAHAVIDTLEELTERLLLSL